MPKFVVGKNGGGNGISRCFRGGGVLGIGRSLGAHRMATPPQRGWHSGLGARMRCRAWRRTRSRGLMRVGASRLLPGSSTTRRPSGPCSGSQTATSAWPKSPRSASRSRSLPPRVNPRAPSGSRRCRSANCGRAAGTPAALREPENMDRACLALVDAGWLLPAPRNGEKHRPAKEFIVNPAI